jgi:SAM-dependent methyltransferase
MEITNPAFDYDRKKHEYSTVRRADPRIHSYVLSGLSGMHTVINVGAGTGSYEPHDRYVASVEPSEKMRLKRLELGRHPAIDAFADSLPFDDDSFDVSLAILTIHHWPSLEKGLAELKRVAKKRIVILTYDPTKLDIFWNAEYFPDVIEVERKRYPELSRIAGIIGIAPKRTNIKVPLDCTDGFQEAFFGRPEYFLREEVRQSQSAWGFIQKELEMKYVEHLRRELEEGSWDKKHGIHRHMKEFEGAYRMLEFT